MAGSKSRKTSSKKTTGPAKKAGKGRKSARKSARPSSPVPGAPAAGGLPTQDELAAFVGMRFVPVPSASEIRHQVKALPGYSLLLGSLADRLEKETVALGLPGITPDGLRDGEAEVGQLTAAESLVLRVYDSIYHQRLTIDSDLMGYLTRLNKRVQNLAVDNPGLAERYKDLAAFLKKFRPGKGDHGDEAPPAAGK